MFPQYHHVLVLRGVSPERPEDDTRGLSVKSHSEHRSLASTPSQQSEVSARGADIWAHDATTRLIAACKPQVEKEGAIPKSFWNEVSSALQRDGYIHTGVQCFNKWKNLKKKHYKEVKDHNAQSGNSRKSWEFLDAMDEVFHKKPEIVPPAIASTSSGLVVNREREVTDACRPPTKKS
ncbi:uncharacterized protein LOC135385442 [Ornithodoros turicata]|uniref:uncharacterized protein LOC135385442 n=1 Tax=Ornithodoros turicata TaxID=34597 RepID=UPI0031386616